MYNIIFVRFVHRRKAHQAHQDVREDEEFFVAFHLEGAIWLVPTVTPFYKKSTIQQDLVLCLRYVHQQHRHEHVAVVCTESTLARS